MLCGTTVVWEPWNLFKTLFSKLYKFFKCLDNNILWALKHLQDIFQWTSHILEMYGQQISHIWECLDLQTGRLKLGNSHQVIYNMCTMQVLSAFLPDANITILSGKRQKNICTSTNENIWTNTKKIYVQIQILVSYQSGILWASSPSLSERPLSTGVRSLNLNRFKPKCPCKICEKFNFDLVLI